jgi:hypothetical protein
MSKPKKRENHVINTSDSDIIEIREEDMKPGKVSKRYRKWLEKKWGRKTPPMQGSKES